MNGSSHFRALNNCGFSGEKQWLFDHKNNRYLDMFGGVVTVSVGHCHPRVVSAMEDQLKKLWHTTSIYLTKPVFEYAEKLTATLPPHLDVCLFANSGLYLIIHIVNLLHFQAPKRMIWHLNWLVCILDALMLCHWEMASMDWLKQWPEPPILATGSSHCRMVLAYLNRCVPILIGECLLEESAGILHHNHSIVHVHAKEVLNSRLPSLSSCSGVCQASDKYIEQFEDTLNYDFPKSTGPSAFIAESIQGVGGVVQYPNGFLKKSFEAIKKRGGLCISDEVRNRNSNEDLWLGSNWIRTTRISFLGIWKPRSCTGHSYNGQGNSKWISDGGSCNNERNR